MAQADDIEIDDEVLTTEQLRMLARDCLLQLRWYSEVLAPRGVELDQALIAELERQVGA